ncbi:protein of unknown function [Candidatus Filomicrobium marinum]|uniref:Uncharacterized protein n=2 Tax=Filomicrobium TaxID=119044 RepID=A0A0D6JAB4_9HYPH|nr:aa3-type cytochrome c oxidase subunit IV [Filomicrobium sp.]CFX01817.1 protein of unknown function [Candidatus Filomicrobium marinum]CPR15519.1 protein of unknown function [Candidatus Filomicrobium marinum]SDO63461.1 aa3 type cytochrome c oxidase subunit IV [Filomicrobium insigne]
MTAQTTETFTESDYADHVRTYRSFVKGIATAAGLILLTLIILAYATM